MDTMVVNDIEYQLNHGKKTATVYKVFANTDVIVVPETINNNYELFSVTAVKGSAFARNGCREIHLPKTIVKIGNRAFVQCGKLEAIYCDNQELLRIGSFAFAYCGNLHNFKIIGAVLLDNAVFYHCRSLCSLEIEACVEIQNSTFANCNNLCEVYFTSKENLKLGDAIFWNCGSLEEVHFNGPVYGDLEILNLAYNGLKISTGGIA